MKGSSKPYNMKKNYGGSPVLVCSVCGREMSEQEALVHKNNQGEKKIICPACFEEATGIDYKTFAFRKENAKQTLFAVALCLGGTVYAFVERGPMWGALGIVLTVLVYLYSSKLK